VDADDRVGLCVAAPEILSYHADRGGAGAGPAFFEDLARALLDRGHRLRLFCNGAEEDAAALARLSAALSDAGAAVETAPVPDRPAALARLVGGCASVIAHRLHACIVAVSYGRPVLGLGWDRKVESFFDEIGAPQAFAAAGTSPGRIAERAGSAAAPEPALRRRLVGEALDGIRATLDAAQTAADGTAPAAAAGATG
jgi:polysaccharide pyruvyl transferase WcaK-like protein